ncbi:hypothetical protein C7S18_09460 [Ahniella affigens]|uniref:Transposase IS66 C-terminal domain-containing protein n=1 Tax=Ahniella affigens TaxID=2021234 RepID=A0A2P1PRC8_9GAMM|nr:hypothetical protein C7S18_09460 [Ahniella affigens]
MDVHQSPLDRKNWLFASSPQAGQRAANTMSLVHSAKATGHDPMAYLADILEQIPVTPPEQIAGLLPPVWKPAQV